MRGHHSSLVHFDTCSNAILAMSCSAAFFCKKVFGEVQVATYSSIVDLKLSAFDGPSLIVRYIGCGMDDLGLQSSACTGQAQKLLSFWVSQEQNNASDLMLCSTTWPFDILVGWPPNLTIQYLLRALLWPGGPRLKSLRYLDNVCLLI